MDEILVPVSAGELVDKLTILRIKAERIVDPHKLANVERETVALEAVAARVLPPSPRLQALEAELSGINADLWQIEDDIRAMESRQDFGPGFIALARSLYILNDRRSAVRRKINMLLGSSLTDEKSYSGYRARG